MKHLFPMEFILYDCWTKRKSSSYIPDSPSPGHRGRLLLRRIIIFILWVASIVTRNICKFQLIFTLTYNKFQVSAQTYHNKVPTPEARLCHMPKMTPCLRLKLRVSGGPSTDESAEKWTYKVDWTEKLSPFWPIAK